MTGGDARVREASHPNDWDRQWDMYGEVAEGNPANDYRHALILKLLGRPPAGATVLDIGSGQGQFALRLQAMYPDLAVWGVDNSAEGEIQTVPVLYQSRPVQAALFFDDSIAASMKAMPLTPSSTVGNRTLAGGARPSRIA